MPAKGKWMFPSDCWESWKVFTLENGESGADGGWFSISLRARHSLLLHGFKEYSLNVSSVEALFQEQGKSGEPGRQGAGPHGASALLNAQSSSSRSQSPLPSLISSTPHLLNYSYSQVFLPISLTLLFLEWPYCPPSTCRCPWSQTELLLW